MKKKLLLITNSYPYGKGETFIESEIDYLSAKFSKIVIISNNITDEQTRIIPKNVSTERLDNSLSIMDKILSIFYIFNKHFLKELFYIKQKLKLNISVFKIKTASLSLFQAYKMKKNINLICEKHLLNKQTDIFYSYWMDDNSLGLAIDSSIKIKLCRVHGWDLFFERSIESYLPFRSEILTKLTVFSISKVGINYLKQKSNVNNIKLSRLGTKKMSLNIREEKLFRIISCSNVIKLKRVGLILESLSLLKSVNIQWIHFGDGPLLSEIKERTKFLKLDATFKGLVSNEAVLSYFKNNQIDLFINLSSSEGIPVSIMEAYSFGIPAMATDVGGTSEIVNNRNGILIKPNPKANEVAHEIKNFISLPKEEVDVKRNAAYMTWNTKFNAEKNYPEFADIISNL